MVGVVAVAGARALVLVVDVRHGALVWGCGQAGACVWAVVGACAVVGAGVEAVLVAGAAVWVRSSHLGWSLGLPIGSPLCWSLGDSLGWQLGRCSCCFSVCF